MISLTSRQSVLFHLHEKAFEFFPLYGAGFGKLFCFLVTGKKSTVSLRLLQCGYSFLPAKGIPDSLSGFIHDIFFLGGGGA